MFVSLVHLLHQILKVAHDYKNSFQFAKLILNLCLSAKKDGKILKHIENAFIKDEKFLSSDMFCTISVFMFSFPYFLIFQTAEYLIASYKYGSFTKVGTSQKGNLNSSK